MATDRGDRAAVAVARDFDSAEDMIAFFAQSPALQSNSIYDAIAPRGLRGIIFRGQWSSQWPLLPSAHRANRPLQRFTVQSPNLDEADALSDRELGLRLGMQLHAEMRAVNIFLRAADRNGVATPIDYTTKQAAYDVINGLLASYSSNGGTPHSDAALPFPPSVLFAELAIAQHHGVPTRLLDWTDSPFIAAFFAAQGVLDRRAGDSRELAVFSLNTSMLKDTDVWVVEAPRHANTYLRAQRGLFTCLPSANKFFLSERRWPAHEDILSDRLCKYTLPASDARELLVALLRFDISPETLMPSLATCASSFQYRANLFGDS